MARQIGKYAYSLQTVYVVIKIYDYLIRRLELALWKIHLLLIDIYRDKGKIIIPFSGMMLNAREPKIVNGPQILDKYVGESEANIR